MRRKEYNYRHPNLVAREVAPLCPYSDIQELSADPESVRSGGKQHMLESLKFSRKVPDSQTSIFSPAVRLQGQAGEAGGARQCPAGQVLHTLRQADRLRLQTGGSRQVRA